MRILFLASIAALFLATGTAQANHMANYECGGKIILMNMQGKGDVEYSIVTNNKEHFLPRRHFRWRDYDGVLYYHGRRCAYVRGTATEDADAFRQGNGLKLK